MRLVGLAIAVSLLGGGAASAQYIPRPMAPVGAASAQDAAEIVEAMGLDPIGPAVRSGPFYVQSARDDFGRVLRVTVDARRSQVVAVEAGVPRALYGPDAGYVPQQYPLHRGPDVALAPPGSIIGSRVPPHAVAPQVGLPPVTQPKPPTKSAAVTPGHPPVPKKRPPSAPQEAAGSVEPLQAAPAPQAQPAAPQKPASPAPSEKPANAMPPVAPLE